MNLLLLEVLFCFLAPSPVAKTNIVYQNNIAAKAEEEQKEEDKKDNNTLENTLLGSGIGLVAVGGVGAGIVAHNNKKPKNVPSKEINNPYDESGEK